MIFVIGSFVLHAAMTATCEIHLCHTILRSGKPNMGMEILISIRNTSSNSPLSVAMFVYRVYWNAIRILTNSLSRSEVACGTWLITTMSQLGFDSFLPSLCNIIFWTLFAATWTQMTTAHEKSRICRREKTSDLSVFNVSVQSLLASHHSQRQHEPLLR